MAEAGMVIVGAGKAGARAVVGLREHGWHGSITLIGEETLPPYDRPPLSKASIMEEGEPAPILLLDEETIHSLGATWLGGSAAVGNGREAEEVNIAACESISHAQPLILNGGQARQ